MKSTCRIILILPKQKHTSFPDRGKETQQDFISIIKAPLHGPARLHTVASSTSLTDFKKQEGGLLWLGT